MRLPSWRVSGHPGSGGRPEGGQGDDVASLGLAVIVMVFIMSL